LLIDQGANAAAYAAVWAGSLNNDLVIH